MHEEFSSEKGVSLSDQLSIDLLTRQRLLASLLRL